MKLREMLELAALAAGLRHIDYSSCDYDGALGIVLLDENGGQGKNWNPHTDDGDALRLAVALNLVVLSDQSGISTANGIRQRAREFHQGNPLAATRRAILRCAAEIGKSIRTEGGAQ